MKLRIRTKAKVFAVDQPCCLEVVDSNGHLVAVVSQPTPDTVNILTPGDPKFELHAAATRTPASIMTVRHNDPPAVLLNQIL